MENLDKILQAQDKQEQNKKHQGKGNPDRKLPNKQHSTNK
ncbi:hypothetical protein Desaci_1952 [Desulfosporosinus acidiphilus SJ4]|uniref:DUF4023 domain-containing protein n=1 Tax=Desulfosporosinus acidiphilus (strain DSM 22704 / JCM 16185 / SJ4) TaxID=646529 RepID=I4D555_DESAJ|nr:DUF4023 family protein [Desulfosporosinus acidiphilus]AFM40929.1 hypothetical protein Desaci_1952 [Desulfosporosinus acidiphilus SJ4]